MLQADCHYAIRSLRRLTAGLSLFDGPGHGLLAVEVLSCSDHVLKMARVAVKRRRHENRIEILHLEHLSVVIESSDSRDKFFHLFVAASVNVRHRDEIDIRNTQSFTHDLLSTRARADNSQPHSIARSQH